MMIQDSCSKIPIREDETVPNKDIRFAVGMFSQAI